MSAQTKNVRCPSCADTMHVHSLAGAHGMPLEIDVCYSCNAIWFDQMESARLSPDGVIELFGLIHQRGTTSARPFSARMACVRCGDGLFEVSDMARNNRFKYRRCPGGHGRLTTFYHFLAEKQFVRTLTKPEREQLCATVKQIKCSSCGAPVDVGQHDACPHCKSPITVLDRNAAEKAVQHYLEMRSKPAAGMSAPRRPAGKQTPLQPANSGWDRYDTVHAADLAVDAVGWLASLAGRRMAAAGLGVGAGAGSPLSAAGAEALGLVPIDEQSRWQQIGSEFAAEGSTFAIEQGLSTATTTAAEFADSSSGLLEGSLDLVGEGVGAVFEIVGGLLS
jgi:DNA-directed RNA polymerase subunit RPC12/RpoP